MFFLNSNVHLELRIKSAILMTVHTLSALTVCDPWTLDILSNAAHKQLMV